MSKKHNKSHSETVSSVVAAHAGEYRIIKHDLVRLLLLNALYLAAVLALYFTNSKSHYLENWFSRILHF